MPTVVIIDDNAFIRQLVRDYIAFAGAGLSVVGEAADGAAGIELVTRTMPDAVIIDWQMPKLDGVAAVPQVRAALPDAVIIMYSSRGHDGAEEAFAAGVDAYIDKEDGPEAVIAELTARLGSQGDA